MPTSSSGSTARSDVSNRSPRIARGSINSRKECRTKRDETGGYQSIYDRAALAHRAGAQRQRARRRQQYVALSGRRARHRVLFQAGHAPAPTSCFTSARAASLSCTGSAACTATAVSTSLAMRRPRPRPASCRSRSLRGRPPSAERVGSFSLEIFCGSSFAGRGCGSFRCGIPLSGYGACSKSAGHNTITIQNYRLRKEKRSGFHFAFFILLGFRGCPARGALRRKHGRPA